MKISILKLVLTCYLRVIMKRITYFLKRAVYDVEKLALIKYGILGNFNHTYKK